MLKTIYLASQRNSPAQPSPASLLILWEPVHSQLEPMKNLVRGLAPGELSIYPEHVAEDRC